MRQHWLKWFIVALSGVIVSAALLFATVRPDEAPLKSASTTPPVATRPEGRRATGTPSPAPDAAIAAELADGSRNLGTAESPGSSPDRGESVFVRRCGGCHTRDEAAGATARQPKARRRAWIADLLERHHPPPASEREPLLDYLVELARRSSERGASQ